MRLSSKKSTKVSSVLRDESITVEEWLHFRIWLRMKALERKLGLEMIRVSASVIKAFFKKDKVKHL